MPKLTGTQCNAPSLLGDFQQGDLLFGLTNQRGSYLQQLQAKKLQYYAANHLNVPLVKALARNKLTEKKLKELPKQEASHARLLLKHSNILMKQGGKAPWDGRTRLQKKYVVAIRRACKLLVKTAKENSNISSIRFVLDGLDMQRICSKKMKDGKVDVSITSGELRAAYKTRWQNNGSIFFYENGKQVPAPWTTEVDKDGHWQTYEKSRLIVKK